MSEWLKIRIPAKLKAHFRAWCKSNNTEMSEELRDYIVRLTSYPRDE